MAKVRRVDEAMDRVAERKIAQMTPPPGAGSTCSPQQPDLAVALSAADELLLLGAGDALTDLFERSITVAITDVMGASDSRTPGCPRRKTAKDFGASGYLGRLTIRGTLSQALGAGETVRVFDGASELGSATVRGRVWTFKDVRSLSGGQAITYTAHIADAAGNLRPASSAYMMTMETAETEH